MLVSVQIRAFLCFIFFEVVLVCDASKNVYGSLIKNIFEDYDIGVRPVTDLSHTVQVGISFGIIQLLTVEDKSKTVQCVSYMTLTWKDEILTWNPDDYNNITQFRYPHTNIWKPDIILTNTPDLNDGPVMNRASTNVLIWSSGKVDMSYTAVYKATCYTMDVKNFPFDNHNCYFDFASWTYSQEQLDIFDGSADFDVTESMQFLPNAEWDLSVKSTEKLIENDTSENQTYPTWRIHVSLTRKPLYFLINMIIPTTITCFVSFLGMFSPSTNSGERTEKAFLGITTLLAVSLLMLTVSAQMPVTSNAVPLIGYFLGVYILTIAVAIICTTVIMHIDVKGLKGKPLPKWAKTVFLLKIGKWMRIYDAPDQCNSEKLPNSATNNSTFTSFTNDGSDGGDGKGNEQNETLINLHNMMSLHFQNLHNLIKEKKMQKEEFNRIRDEWSKVSMVLDKICLIIFLTWSTLFSIVLLGRK